MLGACRHDFELQWLAGIERCECAGQTAVGCQLRVTIGKEKQILCGTGRKTTPQKQKRTRYFEDQVAVASFEKHRQSS